MEDIKLKLNREASAKICQQLLEPFDKSPIEAYLTIIDAFSMAIVVLATQGKQEISSEQENPIERHILDVLKSMSCEKTGLDFDKYIKL